MICSKPIPKELRFLEIALCIALRCQPPGKGIGEIEERPIVPGLFCGYFKLIDFCTEPQLVIFTINTEDNIVKLLIIFHG